VQYILPNYKLNSKKITIESSRSNLIFFVSNLQFAIAATTTIHVHLSFRQGTPNIGTAASSIAQNTKRIDFVQRKSASPLAGGKRKRKSASVGPRTDDREKRPPPPGDPAMRKSHKPTRMTEELTYLTPTVRRHRSTQHPPVPGNFICRTGGVATVGNLNSIADNSEEES
jgi:hypothetical protein